MNSLIRYALGYLEAGISILPLKLDGSKGPALPAWKFLQSRLAMPDEVYEWFSTEAGIGVITGKVSGNLEVIDFDMHQLLAPVLSMLPSSLVNKLSIYETPGGWHVAYRCNEICGNTKIAMWEPIKTPSRTGFGPTTLKLDKGVRLETRGEGGYIVAEGSPLKVHELGIPYCHYMGPRLENVHTITPDERNQIWLMCEQFDLSNQRDEQTQQLAKSLTRKNAKVDHETPWDWFDVVGTWDGILLPLGWKKCGDKAYTRPGKNHGISASVADVDGIELLKVWSTSVGQSRYRSIGKFNALAEMHFGGNKSEAAKHVMELMRQYK